jgi:hypothetical protein
LILTLRVVVHIVTIRFKRLQSMDGSNYKYFRIAHPFVLNWSVRKVNSSTFKRTQLQKVFSTNLQIRVSLNFGPPYTNNYAASNTAHVTAYRVSVTSTCTNKVLKCLYICWHTLITPHFGSTRLSDEKFSKLQYVRHKYGCVDLHADLDNLVLKSSANVAKVLRTQ